VGIEAAGRYRSETTVRISALSGGLSTGPLAGGFAVDQKNFLELKPTQRLSYDGLK